MFYIICLWCYINIYVYMVLFRIIPDHAGSFRIMPGSYCMSPSEDFHLLLLLKTELRNA